MLVKVKPISDIRNGFVYPIYVSIVLFLPYFFLYLYCGEPINKVIYIDEISNIQKVLKHNKQTQCNIQQNSLNLLTNLETFTQYIL